MGIAMWVDSELFCEDPIDRYIVLTEIDGAFFDRLFSVRKLAAGCCYMINTLYLLNNKRHVHTFIHVLHLRFSVSSLSINIERLFRKY